MEKNSVGAISKVPEVILRILYCSESYSPHDHRFLTALGRSGHEIAWLRLLGGSSAQEKRGFPEGVQLVEWDQKKSKISWLDYFRLKNEFKNVVEKVQPDIIHAGPIQRVAFLPALTKFHPLVSMSWGFDMLEDANRNIIWKIITRFVLDRSDWLIADCRTVEKIAMRFGFPKDRMTIFPWGVDLNLFSPGNKIDQRRKIGLDDDFYIIHTRSWESRYGVDIALRGFQKAAASNPKIKIIMLGGGSQEKEIKAFIETHHLSDQVLFHGYQKNEDLADYYRAADIYLTASHIDGSSVALLESMACGCPGLASNIPSNLEWITDGKEGWVFEDGDADALAEAINMAVEKKNELSVLGKAARKKTERLANWDQSVEKLLNTYEKVVEEWNSTK